MKVAICISGHMRSFSACFPQFKKIFIDRYQPDIFISTWNRLDFNFNYLDTKLVENLFHPKKMIIEDENKIVIPDFLKTHPMDPFQKNRVFKQFYKIWSADQLRQNWEKNYNFQYDIVIRYRPDLYFNYFNLRLEDLDVNNYLFVPDFSNFGACCDQFSIGNSNNMMLYSKIYSELQQTIQECHWHPETFLAHTLSKNQVNIFKIPKQFISFVIKRMNGNNTDYQNSQ